MLKKVFGNKQSFSPSNYVAGKDQDKEESCRESFKILSNAGSQIINSNKSIISQPLTKGDMMSEEFEFITPIPEDRYTEVIIHLRNNFFADEPLNKAVGLCRPGKPCVDLESHSIITLRDHLSIMAIDKDTHQVAGVSLNGVLLPGDIQRERKKLENMNDEKFKKIFTLLYDVNEKLNLFSKYNVDKIFDARILSVDSNYRGKRLGKSLIQKAVEVARENSYKIIKGDATGLFSQKILISLGFELVHELKYADHVDENGEQLFKTPAPHESLKIMVKTLE